MAFEQQQEEVQRSLDAEQQRLDAIAKQRVQDQADREAKLREDERKRKQLELADVKKIQAELEKLKV